jgi:4-hydroxy-2-oxoheptanedioate aldolase
MRENRLRTMWQQDKCVVNGWLALPNGFAAETMAHQGWDSLTIDMQHGLVDYQAMVGMLQALRASEVTPLVRVPWLDPAAVMRALDAGAYGVICPMIDNRAQAAEFVSYMRYPPEGTRSFGPTRAAFSAGPNYAGEADRNVLCFAMIETAEAFRNVEDIVSTPGLDGVYIGPSDLTLGLTGKRYPFGFDREEPEMVEAIHTIIAKAHQAGIRAGLHCGGAAYAAKAVGWGFDLVTLPNDVRLLASAAGASVADTRRLIASG